MKIISQYLEMLGNLNRAVDEFYYKSVNDFMKQEGKFYESANLTEDELAHFEQIFNRAGRPRTKKMCFYNAQMIALADKTKKLKYVEGYAVNIFPLPLNHGWLEINGKVIDVTWDADGEMILGNIPEGCEYYGVAFSTKYILEKQVQTECANSLIDCYWDGYELFKTKFNHQP